MKPESVVIGRPHDPNDRLVRLAEVWRAKERRIGKPESWSEPKVPRDFHAPERR